MPRWSWPLIVRARLWNPSSPDQSDIKLGSAMVKGVYTKRCIMSIKQQVLHSFLAPLISMCYVTPTMRAVLNIAAPHSQAGSLTKSEWKVSLSVSEQIGRNS